MTGEVDAKTKEEADKVKKFLRNKDNRKFRKEYGNYFYPITIEANTQDRVKISVIDFKPIDISYYVKELILDYGKNILMMSATILNRDKFCEL